MGASIVPAAQSRSYWSHLSESYRRPQPTDHRRPTRSGAWSHAAMGCAACRDGVRGLLQRLHPVGAEATGLDQQQTRPLSGAERRPSVGAGVSRVHDRQLRHTGRPHEMMLS